MKEDIKAIKIKLNNMDFRYNVFLMVSLFFSFIDIEFVDKDEELSINIDEEFRGTFILISRNAM